jgi:hypothetical protein
VASPVRVLISYAHGDAEHEEVVRRFWTFLRTEGVDAVLDVVAANQRQFWPQWMSEQIRDAQFVLVVASPFYKERAQGTGHASVGRGVRWEARQLQELLYTNFEDGLRRVLPVVLPGGQTEQLPDWLLPVGATVFRVTEFTSDGADALLRVLTGQPWEVEPPLGRVRPRPTRAVAETGWGSQIPRRRATTAVNDQQADLALTPEDLYDLSQEITTVFSRPEEATQLLRLIGYPRHSMPRFRNHIKDWNTAFGAIEDGVLTTPTPYRDILRFALRRYPGNAVLLRIEATCDVAPPA